MNRRAFLKRGLFGGALLAVGGGAGLSLWPGRVLHRPTGPLLALTPETFNVMAAIARRVVTAPGADPVAIAHTIDASLARATVEARNDLLGVLRLFDSAVVGALDGRLGPFTTLSDAEQDRALVAWRDSRLVLLRGAYKALKNLAATSHYRKEATWASVGYPGPPGWLQAIQQAGSVEAATVDGESP